jgi:hypothetical protein
MYKADFTGIKLDKFDKIEFLYSGTIYQVRGVYPSKRNRVLIKDYARDKDGYLEEIRGLSCITIPRWKLQTALTRLGSLVVYSSFRYTENELDLNYNGVEILITPKEVL